MDMARASSCTLQGESNRDMVRKKHGNYDADRQLPDNRMQPAGSGLAVWLQEQIILLIGEEQAQGLIDQAREQGVHRYKYLLQQMELRGYNDLAQKYEEHRRVMEAERRLQAKKFVLRRLQEQVGKETSEARRVYLSKEIKKAEKYIAARQK